MPATIPLDRPALERPRPLAGAGLAAVLSAALLLGACVDYDIINTNAPTVEELTGSPTQPVLARAATGIFAQAPADVAGEIEFYSIYGREGYNLLGNDPRETGEQIRGPLDPGGRGGGNWAGKYQAIRTLNAYLAALPNAVGLTDAQVSASRGFARTIKAWHIHRLAVRSGSLGIPIDVDRPITAEPAPFVSFSDAMGYASALMDSAYADLQAGGGSFPFTMAPGYTGFSSPADFAKFNRALAAKVYTHRATFTTCAACWASAASALNQSFITTAGLPGSLATGVYYAYSTASGEPRNPVSENITATRYYVHPSILTGAQLRASGQPDLRLSGKVTAAPTTRSLNDLAGTHKPTMFNSASNPAVADLGSDIAWIRNEELLLLRAEVRWNNGDKAGAIADLDLVRVNAGGLPPTTLTAGSTTEAFVAELLYNRVYSLLWEQGTRWIDARRYNRLNTLPLDRAGDSRHTEMVVPSSECDSRGLTVPCNPLGG